MRKILFTAALFLTAGIIKAQKETNYAHWIELGAEKELINNLDLEFSEEIRYFFDLNALDETKTSLGLSYKLTDRLSFGAQYTWTYKHQTDDDFYTHRHRISGYIKMEDKFGNFEISLCEKLQINYLEKEDEENGDYSPKTNLRSRLKISYDIPSSKVEPYLQAQVRLKVNDPECNELDNERFAAGVEFPLLKKLKMDTFFQLDQELNRKSPDKIWIIGTNLKFKL